MAKLTLSDARRAMGRRRPWTFCMEFHDAIANSHKFWLATGRGRHEPVEVHYGRIGGKSQIIIKDWDYLETKAPDKEAKGYRYVDTVYVRVQQSTIDAHAAKALTTAAKPLPAKVAPVQKSQPPAPVPQPTGKPLEWRCDVGGVTVALTPLGIELKMDSFPRPWMTQSKTAGTLLGTFKAELRDFCGARMKKYGPFVWWGGVGSVDFKVHSTEKSLFRAIVGWLQKQIGSKATALAPASMLPGPFGKVVSVKAMGKGIWHAINAQGNKVLSMSAQGARNLVVEHPHITVAGL